jgi:hypothetical protein
VTADPPAWRRSTRCGTNACVEVSMGGEGSNLMRDSKLKASPILAFGDQAWVSFLDGIRAGDYDRS